MAYFNGIYVECEPPGLLILILLILKPGAPKLIASCAPDSGTV